MPETTLCSTEDGLIIKGTVTGYKDRQSEQSQKKRRTYRIVAAGQEVYVDAYEPYPHISIMDNVTLPVKVRTYISKQGSSQYGLTLRTERDDWTTE